MNGEFTYDDLMNVHRSQMDIDGKTITTLTFRASLCNILAVTAGTTGHCGGDSGHGGRTYLKLEDHGSTDLMVRIDGQGGFEECISVELRLGGDHELDTLLHCLEFAVKVLRSQRSEFEQRAF